MPPTQSTGLGLAWSYLAFLHRDVLGPAPQVGAQLGRRHVAAGRLLDRDRKLGRHPPAAHRAVEYLLREAGRLGQLRLAPEQRDRARDRGAATVEPHLMP